MAKLVLQTSELPLEDGQILWGELSAEPISERAILNAVANWAKALLSAEDVSQFKDYRRKLSDSLTLLDRYRSNLRRFTPRSKPCKQCTTLVFWAMVAPVTDVRHAQWIPFEADPLHQPLGMPEAFCWEMNTDTHPPECVNTRPADGQYWVDHRQTCGDRPGPNRPCEPYLQRWRLNSQRVGKDARLAMANLLELQKKLAEGEP